jgi:hypothetical protein
MTNLYKLIDPASTEPFNQIFESYLRNYGNYQLEEYIKGYEKVMNAAIKILEDKAIKIHGLGFVLEQYRFFFIEDKNGKHLESGLRDDLDCPEFTDAFIQIVINSEEGDCFTRLKNFFELVNNGLPIESVVTAMMNTPESGEIRLDSVINCSPLKHAGGNLPEAFAKILRFKKRFDQVLEGGPPKKMATELKRIEDEYNDPSFNFLLITYVYKSTRHWHIKLDIPAERAGPQEGPPAQIPGTNAGRANARGKHGTDYPKKIAGIASGFSNQRCKSGGARSYRTTIRGG